MQSVKPQSIQIMQGQGGVELIIKAHLPYTFFANNINPPHPEQPNATNNSRQPPQRPSNGSSKKTRAASLIQQKKNTHPQESAREEPRARLDSSSIPPTARRQNALNRPSQDRQARERTRENRAPPHPSTPTNQRRTKERPNKQYQYSKLDFAPKFNLFDNIFAVYRQRYSLVSASSQGFMIVNQYPCSKREASCLEFKILIRNVDNDDCGVGITYRPVNLLQRRLRNPVERCLAFYFGRKLLRVGGATFENPRVHAETYRLIVSIGTRQFILLDGNGDTLIKNTIPREFLENELYFFLEIKNGGQVQIIQ